MSDKPLIFIAYFGPDRGAAVSLHGALAARGHRPWCDAVDLLPGDLWDELIPARLKEATIILVLVSTTAHDGWYARAEVAEAIDRARADRNRRVIPVMLEGATKEDVPYGLRRVSHIDAKRHDFTAVVDGMDRLLARLSDAPTPSADRPSQGPITAGHGNAPHLDLHGLVQATIRRRLDRDLLLSWLPDDLRAMMPTHRTYFEQITSDLEFLQRAGKLSDGQYALEVWLRQAERLAGPFAEARVYRAALQALAGQS